jgi:hypothetical protein
MEKAKLIAFYLPQYHPFKENDEWWGKGFSEWTNVCKAKKIFPGHEQPKLPGELGFYDLRLKETRQDQANLAKKYGVDGFCYYYYRLNKNVHLMDYPLKEVLRLKEPRFPFMLCWANHDWQEKLWNSDKGNTKRTLVTQEYGDDEDIKDYFMEVLPYFKDDRYIKIDDSPLFSVHRPLDIPNVKHFIDIWNDLAKKNGFNGVKFIGYTFEIKKERNEIINNGFWTVTSNKMFATRHNRSIIYRYTDAAIRHLFRIPWIENYRHVIKSLVGDEEKDETVNPLIMPNWDQSPRRGRFCMVWTHATPELFKEHVKNVLETIRNKENKVVFIKSWNEWGEGNYLEPDRK